MRDGDKRRSHIKDRNAADRDLAEEAERQRERVNRGLDGAHKPEAKFPIEEAEEAGDPVHKTPHKRHYHSKRSQVKCKGAMMCTARRLIVLLLIILHAGLLTSCFPRPH